MHHRLFVNAIPLQAMDLKAVDEGRRGRGQAPVVADDGGVIAVTPSADGGVDPGRFRDRAAGEPDRDGIQEKGLGGGLDVRGQRRPVEAEARFDQPARQTLRPVQCISSPPLTFSASPVM